MSADQRSVATDALETLGFVIGLDEKRDAIHLAVEPIEAGTTLKPGQHVCIIDGKATYLTRDRQAVGIVDPFLREAVKPGQRFWLVVYPRQISSLRHVWEHPDFPASGETEHLAVSAAKEIGTKEKAYQWIEEYAESLSGTDSEDQEYTVTADELIDIAMTHVHTTKSWGGDYLVKGGLLEGEGTSPEFWEKLAIYKAMDIPHEKRNNFFSCSC